MKQHTCLIYILKNKEEVIDYVGRTRRDRLRARMYEHRQTLKCKPVYEVIDQCSENCRDVEKKWIAHYRELGCQLRNINYGQGPHFLPPEAIQKLKDKMTGRPVTWGDKIRIAQTGQPRNWSEEGLERQLKTRFQSGRVTTQEEIEKVRKGLLNRVVTEEELRKRSESSTRNNLRMWANRTPEEKSRIGKKISETRKRNYTQEQISEQARKGGQATKGIKKRVKFVPGSENAFQ